MKKVKEQLYLQAFTKNDFTDERIKTFVAQKNNYSIKEYGNFLESIKIENEFSINILNFLAFYEDGCLCPTKCDAYEPLREVFDPNDISEPVRWLSQPGSAFYFKRTKSRFKCDGAIENHSFPPIWENGGTKLLEPLAPEPEFLGEISLWFDKNDLTKYKKDNQFIEEILHEIDKIIEVSTYKIELRS